jgi:uncharacterized protein (DUF1330 family)
MMMAKAYWVATYRSIGNPDLLAEYAKLAAPAMAAGGAKFLARGNPVKVMENAANNRIVIIEFPSAAAAIATYESAGYQAAAKVLAGTVDRDIRIVEAVE